MIITDTVRTLPNGDPVPAGELVTIKLVETGTTLGTVSTDTKGSFTFYVPGNPGDVEYSVNVGSGVKRHATRSIMPVGSLDLSALTPFLQAWSDGVVERYGGGLAVTASGSSMQLTVASGCGMAQGMLYHSRDPQTLTVPAADASNNRLDLVILRFTLTGPNAGRVALAYLTGTPAATPVVPALVQDVGGWDGVLYEMPLAVVSVDKLVSAIATNKVADARPFCLPQKVETAIDVQEGSTSVVPKATALNFNTSNFDLTATGNKANINLSLGTGAFQAAAGNHTHGTATILDGAITLAKLSASAKEPAKAGTAISGVATLTGNAGPFTAQTITGLDVTRPHLVVLVAFMRAYGSGSTFGQGSAYVTIASENGADSPPLQYDQGVDSTGVATHVKTVAAGASSVVLSWGWHHTSGTVEVRGTTLLWVVIPV